jgi:hypothetical protein
MARQVQRVPERVGRIASLRDGREIEDGKRRHRGDMGAPSVIHNLELITGHRSAAHGVIQSNFEVCE